MPTFYGAIDLSKNELRNAVVQNLGSAPATPSKGQIYYDSTANILYWWNGSQWIPAQAAAGATPAATVTTQAVGDAPVVGVSTNFAREDHKHGREAFGAISAQTAFGLSSSNGAAATLARSDHNHGTPAAPVIPGVATTVSTSAAGDGGVVGVATTYAREDHKHGRESFGFVTLEQTFGTGPSNGSALTLSRSDHLHGNPTHVAADHSTIPLNALAQATGNYDMGVFRITGVGTPTAGLDAANKGYVDSLVQGMSWKTAVRVASAGANSAASGLIAVDGVTVAAGDRVLLKDQTTASANGIYVAAAGAWARATDADVSAEIVGMAVFAEEGTVNADTAWVCTTNAPITLGTTSLAFAQFAGGGSVIAGAGMTQVSNTLNVIAGDSSVVVNPDELHINTAVIATVASVTAGDAANVPNTRQVIAGAGLTGGGALSADATLNVIAGDTSLVVNADEVHVNTAVIAPTSRLINTTAPLTGGGNLTADRTLAISNFAGSVPGAVPTSPGGTTQFLRADGTWSAPAGGVGKYAAALAGTSSPEVVTHGLGTRDVQVTVLNGASPYTAVEVDWDATTTTTVTVRYNPNLGAGYRVVVVG